MNKDLLFVLNGECALEGFLQSKCPLVEKGALLAWKEIYTEGPLPLGGSLEEFRKVRAAFLAGGIAPAELTSSRLEKHLERMEETLFAQWKKGGEVVLFLDGCMFDQGIFARLLFLAEYFRKKETLFPQLSFACRDLIYSKDSPFMELFAEREAVSPKLLGLAEEIWSNYALCRTPGKELLEKLPFFLGKGLVRRGEEDPSTDPYLLTRTERELLFLLQKKGEKGETPLNLFMGLDALEEYPFLGDTGCWRLLESLRKRGFLLYPGKKEIPSLTFPELQKELLFPGEKLMKIKLL